MRVHRNVPSMLMFPIRAMYLEAIDRAQHHTYLTHAYFIPDSAITTEPRRARCTRSASSASSGEAPAS